MTSDSSRQQGVALVVVLWVLALMTIMAGSYALSTQREASLLSHAHERSKAVALADGGIHYAMFMLMLPNPKQRWRADGTPYLWQHEDSRVRVRALDEAGKIDLNIAQELTLRSVFNLLLGSDDEAAALTDAILDWRDVDKLKRTHGAEEEEYRAAGRKQMPQNRNFLVLEELRGVLGVTPELYRRLEPWFTLYTNQDGLNPVKASREVLLAMAHGDQAIVETFLEQRRLAPNGAALQTFPPVPGLKFIQTADMAYTIEAEALIPGQPGTAVRAAVKRGQGPGGTPFVFLNWKARAATHSQNPNHPHVEP